MFSGSLLDQTSSLSVYDNQNLLHDLHQQMLFPNIIEWTCECDISFYKRLKVSKAKNIFIFLCPYFTLEALTKKVRDRGI